MSGDFANDMLLSADERARLDAAHRRLASVGREPGDGAAAVASRPATTAGAVTPPAAPAPSRTRLAITFTRKQAAA